MPPENGGTFGCESRKLLAFLVLALLVGNAAAGLASGLAGSLAFAAAAVLGALAQVLGLEGLDVAHNWHLRSGGNLSMGVFYQIIGGKSILFTTHADSDYDIKKAFRTSASPPGLSRFTS